MTDYIINKEKTDGRYNEVHQLTCSHLPLIRNCITLGYFNNGEEAVKYAKYHGYSDADGCAYCCSEAHHG